MKAIVARSDAPAGIRQIELPDPVPGPGQVLVEISAAAVNRADLLQVAGRYPPPPGATEVLGLEAAGIVKATGPDVTRPEVGARVMALLAGGGYADRVVVPAGQSMLVPANIDLEQAAAVPEAYLTAWRALTRLAPVSPGEPVLVHAAASGVGTAAIQIARELGASPVIGTVRSHAKVATVAELGGTPILVQDGRFADEVMDLTDGAGAAVIVDMVGASYWPQTLRCLAEGGRIAVVGLLGGATIELDMASLMRRQARIAGGTLRARSEAEKASLVDSFAEWGLPRLQDGRLRPVIAASLPMGSVAEAHALVGRNAPAGKVVLTNT